MRHVIAPGSSRSQWLSYDNRHNLEDLVDKTRQSNILISDLDGTLADCQATKIILNAFFLEHPFWQTPELAIRGMDSFVRGEARKEFHWNWYSDTHLLENCRIFSSVVQRYTPSFANDQLYKGVPETFAEIAGSKYLVTRNTKGVAWAFTTALGFDQAYHRSNNKRKAAETALEDARSKGPVSVAVALGNSASDFEVVDFLRKQVETVVGIYVGKRPSDESAIVNRYKFQVSSGSYAVLAEYLAAHK